jgi:hypothetical protein
MYKKSDRNNLQYNEDEFSVYNILSLQRFKNY